MFSTSASRAARGSRRARGFTLVEILVVITLAAALSAMLFAVMSGGMDGVRMRTTAKELMAELRFARAQAISTGTVQRFTIDPKQRRWTGAKDRRGEISEDFEIAFVGVRQVQRRDDEGVILFFEDGASTGGRIQLLRKRAVWNIDVAWLTGEVGLHRGEAER